MDVSARIEKTGLVPVAVIDNPADAPMTAKAIHDGGIDVMEITLRTGEAFLSIKEVSDEVPDVLVGAGTVLTVKQASDAVQYGAKFIVSPGFDAEVVGWCADNKIPVYPGCVTPTEIGAALKHGFDTLKFFPAAVYGGAAALKALSGPFPKAKFIPTGGIDLSNLAEFALPQVAAVGGAWLCSRDDIWKRNFAHITELCKESVKVLAAARK
jgi:2-dehydro-3-deoxyphosphogluconate aldolase/(4S)-4-hydroxy-2-oxoglutarate aldolase